MKIKFGKLTEIDPFCAVNSVYVELDNGTQIEATDKNTLVRRYAGRGCLYNHVTIEDSESGVRKIVLAYPSPDFSVGHPHPDYECVNEIIEKCGFSMGGILPENEVPTDIKATVDTLQQPRGILRVLEAA